MATIRRFEDIQAWQKARELVRQIYQICSCGPFRRDFSLRNQICSAAVSSMSNIAEGFARRSSRELTRFLDIARGSAVEVQSLLYVSFDVGYIDAEQFQRLYKLTQEVTALIGGFTTYLRSLRAVQR
jgi:four helix bundle protein